MGLFTFLTGYWAVQQLTAYGLSYGLNYGLDRRKGNVTFDKEIHEALDEAINIWDSKNNVKEPTRLFLKRQAGKYIKSPELIENISIDNTELDKFYMVFSKVLSKKKYKHAYDRIKEIKGIERYKAVMSELSNLSEDHEELKNDHAEIIELITKSQLDPRDIEDYIKELSRFLEYQKKKETINSWYKLRKISPDVKELLLVVIKAINDQNISLTVEISKLKQVGNSESALFLENLQKNIEQGSGNKIRTDYFSYQEKQKIENVQILKKSIEATKVLFAFNETLELYKELIKIEPTDTNFFQYAYFLQSRNNFEEAEEFYGKSLKLRKELENENPKTYKPLVVLTLSNLATIHNYKHEFEKAQDYFVEALSKQREIVDVDSDYLPELAMTLNNLNALYFDKKEYARALVYLKESIDVRRDVASSNETDVNFYELTMSLHNLGVLYKVMKDYPKSQEAFEDALSRIERIYEQKNHQSDLATVLDGYASLFYSKIDYKNAFINYNKSIKIREVLAKKDSIAYLPQLAYSLNNIAVLFNTVGKKEISLRYYYRALSIKKDLARENPKIYNIDYADKLIMGVHLFKLDIEKLEEAKNILIEYPKNPKAEELLKRIDAWRK